MIMNTIANDLNRLGNWLQPGCDHFERKLRFFCLGEQWTTAGLAPDQLKLLRHSFALVKQQAATAYYHTLFHLLSCSFCVDRGYPLLAARSHPQLWRLATELPGDYIEIVAQAQQADGDAALDYFALLYKKLVLPMAMSRPVLIYLGHGRQRRRQLLPPATAAGMSRKLPPQIDISELPGANHQQAALVVEPNAIDNQLDIGLHGLSAETRMLLTVLVHFIDGTQTKLAGHDLVAGGDVEPGAGPGGYDLSDRRRCRTGVRNGANFGWGFRSMPEARSGLSLSSFAYTSAWSIAVSMVALPSCERIAERLLFFNAARSISANAIASSSKSSRSIAPRPARIPSVMSGPPMPRHVRWRWPRAFVPRPSKAGTIHWY